MRHGSNFQRLMSAFIAWMYIGTLSGGCVGAPAQEGDAAKPAGFHRDALVEPAFVPFRPFGPNDAVKPSASSFDVTPTGSAVWSMPLWIPPGRLGLQPGIAISYDSKGGSGPLGQGFGLGGLSAVARCWSTPAQDGRYSGGTTAGLADELCLDGQRLVPDGTPNEFRLELDPGTLVRAQGTLPNPISFEVRRANGRIGRYGARDTASSPSNSVVRGKGISISAQLSTNAGAPFVTDLMTESLGSQDTTIAWNLDREEDRFGNFIEYDYLKTVDSTLPGAVEVVPKEIRWTGYEGSGAPIAPSRFLKFSYSPNPKLDPRTSFRGGLAVKNSQLLTGIEVSANEGLAASSTRTLRVFRTYSFGYLPTTAGKRVVDRLTTITECAFSSASNSQCLDPITFSWSGTDTSDTPSFAPGVELADAFDFPLDVAGDRPNFAADVFDATVGDFNGDGRADYLYRLPRRVEGPNETHRFASVNGNERAGIGEWFLRLGAAEGLGPRLTLAGLPRTPGGDFKFSARSVDIDGDGKNELILYSEAVPPAIGASQYLSFGLVCPAQGACDFQVKPGVQETTEVPFLGDSFPRRSFALQVGDFDGDGVADLIRENAGSQQVGGSVTNLLMRKANGTGGFATPALIAVVGNPSDGAGNILTHLFDERHVADLDGDGQPELVTPTYNLSVTTSARGTPYTFSSISIPLVGGPGSSRRVQTTLHAQTVEDSLVMEAVVGTCAGQVQVTTTPPTQFTRFFMDMNADGLVDSVASPSALADNCVNIRVDATTHEITTLPASRSVGAKTFVSINTGNGFRPPVHTQWSMENRIHPAINTTNFGAHRKGVDPGARVVDLDGDGRDDLLLVSNGGPPALVRTNMVWLRSNGTDFTAVPLALTATSDFWPDMNSVEGGFGPRLTHVADFNGDGLPDVVQPEVLYSPQGQPRDRLMFYAQNPRPPDMVVAISGGPHQPRVSIAYARGSVATPGLYTPGQCTWPQACLKSLGWVVSSHSIEATAFESVPVTVNVFEHRYADARLDVLGRGMLGVGSYQRRLLTDALRPVLIEERKLEFDLDSKVCRSTAGVPRCTYTMLDRPSRATSITTLGAAGSHVVETRVKRNTLFDGLLYRTQQEIAVVDELEGPVGNPALLRSKRTVRTLDAFGSTVSNSTEVFDTSLPLTATAANGIRTTSRAVGPSNADTTSWLLSRYATYELESFDPSLPAAEQTLVRTTEVQYEPTSVEPRVVITEPGAADPGPRPTGSDFFSTTTTRRDAHGNLVSVRQAGSNQTRTSSFGFPASDPDQIFPATATNALNQTVTAWVDSVFGLPQAIDDANGIRTVFEFDGLGRATFFRAPGGPQVTLSHKSELTPMGARRRTESECSMSNASGVSCKVVDPMGRVVRSMGDGFDIGIEREFTYDRLGHLTQETLPHGSSNGLAPLAVDQVVDNLGRLLSRTRPGETRTATRFTSSWSYKARTVTRENERGVKSTSEFDPRGRLVREATREPGGTHDVATITTYGHFDLPTAIAHPLLPGSQAMNPAPRPLVTTMNYDRLGRREHLSDPDTGDVSTVYNAFGEVKAGVDANGSETAYEYDLLGRLKKVSTPVSSAYPSSVGNAWAELSEFFYDTANNGIGKLARTTSNDGVENQLSYNANGALESSSWKESNVTYDFAFTYTPNGQVRTLTYPSSSGQPFRVQYDYAGNGDVREIWNVSARPNVAPELIWRQTSRNANGQSTEEQFGQSIRTRRAYDAAYQLRLQTTELVASQQPLQRLSYNWGADALMKSRIDLDQKTLETFTHDFLDRLETWKVTQNCDTVEWTYGYDDWGNLRTRDRTMGPTTLPSRTLDYTLPGEVSRPHAMKRLTEGTGPGAVVEQFAYNAAGQMTQGRGNTFTWAPNGLPWRVANAAAVSVFAYDGGGSRIAERQSVLGNLKQHITVGGLYSSRPPPRAIVASA